MRLAFDVTSSMPKFDPHIVAKTTANRIAEPAFVDPVDVPNWKMADKENLRRATEEWIATHPEYYALIKKEAVKLVAAGRRFSIDLVTELVKYKHRLYSRLKLGNNMRPYLSRALAKDIPGYEKLVKFRETQW